jgi:MFS family permease
MMDLTLEQETPESQPTEVAALQEPTERKSLGWQVLYWLANSTIGFGNIVFYTLLLPFKIAAIVPTAQANAFLWISGAGAVAALLTNPLVGALSDRTTSPLGRRFLWLLAGVALLLLSMFLLSVVATVLLLVLGAVLLQISINVLLAALSALIPDQVPVSQRAMVGAWGGMAPLVGGLVGQILVGQYFREGNMAFLDLAILAALGVLAFSLVLRETPLPKAAAEPWRLRDLPRSLWLSPRQHPAFALVWLARTLIFLAATTVINYLYSYLLAERLVPPALVASGVQRFFTVYVGCIVVSSLLSGKLSDVWQRRKPFVISGSLLMAAGMGLLVIPSTWTLALVAAAVLGTGFGTYLSSDLALASQLLPEARHRGKDVGLMNVCIFLPMLLATGLALVALDQWQSFLVFFGIVGLGCLVAACLIVPIQRVR